jgi:hypothetical protein
LQPPLPLQEKLLIRENKVGSWQEAVGKRQLAKKQIIIIIYAFKHSII